MYLSVRQVCRNFSTGIKKALLPIKVGDVGERKNFFSREKEFFPSLTPPSFFKKSEVWLLQFVAAEPLEKIDDHFFIIDQLPILGTELIRKTIDFLNVLLISKITINNIGIYKINLTKLLLHVILRTIMYNENNMCGIKNAN